MNNKPALRLIGLPQPDPGYVYLINAVGTNKFKIGRTGATVPQRIATLQVGCPVRLRYVYHAYVVNSNQVERDLHCQFACFRDFGEWFSLNHVNVKNCITLMRLVQISEPPSLLLPKPEAAHIENSQTNVLCMNSANADDELRERIHQLQARGYGKAKIILEVWEVSKGGSPKYKAAEAEYKRLLGEA